MLTPEQLVESHRIASAKYASKNRPAMRAYTNNYYAANKEKILARRKEKRAAAKEVSLKESLVVE
jgi:hypothetical protein